MPDPQEYDLVVLGSGRARFFAWSLASQGKRVAVVERRNVAGSCPTVACAPSKNVIHGARVANYFRRGAEFGIAAGDWKVEMPAVRDRKRKMVDSKPREITWRGETVHTSVWKEPVQLSHCSTITSARVFTAWVGLAGTYCFGDGVNGLGSSAYRLCAGQLNNTVSHLPGVRR